MRERKGIAKRAILLGLALTMLLSICAATVIGASAESGAVSTFDDGYELKANWIWADTEVQPGQWVALRKTFVLDEVPESFVARISADTKYWLWINGKQVIFEGQLKLGDSRDTWYYDKEELAQYLVAGENTVAAQVFYSGKTSGSTINTRVPSFLFDAEVNGTRIVSDTTWRAVRDVAYQEPVSLNNDRNGEANIKYNAALTMTDGEGHIWTDKDYDDSAWGFATNQDEKIRTNRIYDDSGAVSGVYFNNTDPRRKLVLRSIPQLKVDEITKFTADGANGTGEWVKTEGGYTFAPLSLPDTYTLEAEVIVADPVKYTDYGAVGAGIGFCVCVSDANNLYMPQISFRQASSFDGVRFKPHVRKSGKWTSTTTNLTTSEIGKSLYVSGSHDYRYNTKHTVKIEVTPSAIKTYLNGTLLGTMTDTSLPRAGSTVGLRQDINELLYLYSMRVTDTNGNELYDAGISELGAGSSASRLSLLTSENTAYSTEYNSVKKDASGISYVPIRNCRVAINDGTFTSTYKITNSTNVQGTPYLKVKSTSGGEIIGIKSDSWVNGSSTSIAHQYVTRAGECEWEALGWMNGYEITFTVPETVQVLELGFRKSGYDTEHTGSVVTDSAVLNQLYREAYDTLYVCMRDSYMDCPDRERCQWLGDAVVNMQQAAYAMDDKAALLYAKTLKQALGFVKANGAIPSKIALGRPDLELPMQSLAGVHSFWQYYMYYGDSELVVDAYPVLINYLKLWDVSESGVITHRDGNWNWYDWGSNPDTVIIENCWYYEALDAVLNIAGLEGSGATADDIAFLEGRMELIGKNFDALYWNAERNAYYNKTDNGAADDRANAMAIYTGLADPSRHEGILSVLSGTYNAGPYMEKYVLEAMYMMGEDDAAVKRTLDRFGPFTEDGYPTLPEIWLDQTLYGGDETKNHAWTGAPLSMLYMYNAGITPLSPGFKTVQVRPQAGTLGSISASVTRGSGTILVSLERAGGVYTLDVTIPAGADGGVIWVPRVDGKDTVISLGGNAVFANGAALAMPAGVSYVGEDVDFVGFSVPAGTYTFTAEENTATGSESCKVTLSATAGGTVTVGGESVSELTVTKGESVTVTVTPDAGYRIVGIVGSYPERIVSGEKITRTYTVNSDMTVSAVFAEKPVETRLLTVTTSTSDVAAYALIVRINGTQVSLPYSGSFASGTAVAVEAVSSAPHNYSVTVNGVAATVSEVVLNEDTELEIVIAEKSTVNKMPVSSVTASTASANDTSWDETKVIDGIRISNGTSNGYSTGWRGNPDVSANPHVLIFDLGSVQTINQIAMFPRSDCWAADSSLSCSYPTDFTVSVSTDGSTYSTVVAVKGGENPRFKQQCYSFDPTEARYVKISVTRMGLPPYNDGSNNDHYRLQLAEVEIYYNGELAAIQGYKPQMSITLDADLITNVYVPTSGTLKFTLDGTEYADMSALADLICELDGISYYRMSIPLASSEAARDIILVATVDAGDSNASGTFTFNTVSYAKALIAGGSAVEATLAKDILSYVRAAYIYFGRGTDAAVAEIGAVLGEGYDEANKPALAGSAESVTTGLVGATLVLDATPAIRFYLAEDADASRYAFCVGGVTVNASTGTDVNGRYIELDVYAYRMCDTVTYTVDGAEGGSYHINSYYTYAKENGTAELVCLVERFAKYCESAAAYRASVIGQ